MQETLQLIQQHWNMDINMFWSFFKYYVRLESTLIYKVTHKNSFLGKILYYKFWSSNRNKSLWKWTLCIKRAINLISNHYNKFSTFGNTRNLTKCITRRAYFSDVKYLYFLYFWDLCPFWTPNLIAHDENRKRNSSC